MSKPNPSPFYQHHAETLFAAIKHGTPEQVANWLQGFCETVSRWNAGPESATCGVAFWQEIAENFHRAAKLAQEAATQALKERDEARAELNRLQGQVQNAAQSGKSWEVETQSPPEQRDINHADFGLKQAISDALSKDKQPAPEQPKAQILRIGQEPAQTRRGLVCGPNWQFGGNRTLGQHCGGDSHGWIFAQLRYIARNGWIPMQWQRPQEGQAVLAENAVGVGKLLWNAGSEWGNGYFRWQPYFEAEPLEVNE